MCTYVYEYINVMYNIYCAGYFSIAVVEHHGQGNSQKEALYRAYGFKSLDDAGGKACQQTAESTRLEQQSEGRERAMRRAEVF